MKTILTALRDEDKVENEEARTIARALGGVTIAGAVSPVDENAGQESDSEPESNDGTS